MDKDLVITAIMMMLSSMQSTPAPESHASIASDHPTIERHVDRLYSHQQRIHDRQGCGKFVLYG